MKDDDPYNYPARSYERLLEIRNLLTRIVLLLEILLVGLLGWSINFLYRK